MTHTLSCLQWDKEKLINIGGCSLIPTSCSSPHDGPSPTGVDVVVALAAGAGCGLLLLLAAAAVKKVVTLVNFEQISAFSPSFSSFQHRWGNFFSTSFSFFFSFLFSSRLASSRRLFSCFAAVFLDPFCTCAVRWTNPM